MRQQKWESGPSQWWWPWQSFKDMGIKDLGGWYIGLEAQEEARCHFQVPLHLRVCSYNLPSEVKLSPGGGTPEMRESQAHGL